MGLLMLEGVCCMLFIVSLLLYSGWGVSACGPCAWCWWWWWPWGSWRPARTKTRWSGGDWPLGSDRARLLRWRNTLLVIIVFITLSHYSEFTRCCDWCEGEKYWRQKCGEGRHHQAEGWGGGQGGQAQQSAPGQFLFVLLVASVALFLIFIYCKLSALDQEICEHEDHVKVQTWMSECNFQTRRSRGRLLSRLRHQETGKEAGNNDVTENNASQEVKMLWLMDSLRTLACSDTVGNELSVC